MTAVSFMRLPLQLRRHDILSYKRENGADTWAGVSADKGQDIVAIGDIEFDWKKKSVTRMGRDMRLRPKEFYLLGLLISNPGRTYARDDIRRIVWWRSSIDLRTVDATIGSLRRAINRGYLPDPIATVLERGYKFCENFDQIHSTWLAGGNRKLRLSKTSRKKSLADTSTRPVGD
jgi:DNA-binding response OmpR family regulator